MNLFIKDEYGHIMTISPEELKEKLGITLDAYDSLWTCTPSA